MHALTKLAALPVAGLIALGGALVAQGPAMADGCTGASCSEGTSVQVQATITLALTQGTSFAFGGGLPVAAGTSVGPLGGTGPTGGCESSVAIIGTPAGPQGLCGDLMLKVTTGDGAGYVVGSYGTDLTSGSKVIPVTGVHVYLRDSGNPTAGDFGSGAVAETADSAHPVQVASSSTASAGPGDVFSQYDELDVPASIGNGAFAGSLSMVAVAN